jgi:general secretion pathway protein J
MLQYLNHRKMFRRTNRSGTGLRSGFTLVELSIVILVLSVLFSMMFGIYFSVSRLITDSKKNLIDKSASVLALENIRSSLSQVYFQDDVKRLVFFGRKNGNDDNRRDVITFAASNPGSEELGIPEVREVSYYIDEQTFSLMKREDMHVDEDPGQGGNHHVLLANVKSLQFSYSSGNGEWFDTWNSVRSKKIPYLIRIRMKVEMEKHTEIFETMVSVNVGRQGR